jgi:hypothetical protein
VERRNGHGPDLNRSAADGNQGLEREVV